MGIVLAGNFSHLKHVVKSQSCLPNSYERPELDNFPLPAASAYLPANSTVLQVEPITFQQPIPRSSS